MVQFNPQQPNVQDPNYIFWSRPIEQPRADISKEVALKGAGELFKEGVTVGKDVTEFSIQDDVHKQAEPVTDKYINNLSQLNAAVLGQTGAYDVLKTQDPSQSQHPQELQSLPNKVDTLVSARDNGKLSPSAYDAQIYSIAKNLRNKYPGFRDYVDEQMYRATGVHPANQLVRSLIQDYDSAVQNSRTEANKLDTEAMTVMGYPGVEEAYRNYKSGNDPTGDKLRDAVIRGKASKSRLEADDLRLRNANMNRENKQHIAEESASRTADGMVSASMSSLMLPFDTPMSFDDFQKKLDSGYKPSPEESQILSNWIASQKTKVGAQLDRQFAGSDLPEAKKKEIINGALTTFDRYQDLTDNEHHGLAGYAARVVKSKDENTAYNMSNLPSAEILRRVKILGDTIGKTGNQYTAAALQNLLKDIQKASQDFLLSETGNAIDPNDPKSLDSTFQKWRTLGIGADPNKPKTYTGTAVVAPDTGGGMNVGMGSSKLQAFNDARMYWNFMSTLTHMLYDKQSPPAAKVAASAVLYHQDNQLYLDYFQHDQTDGKGRFIPGANTMFSDVYGPKAAEAVRKTTPEKWETFRNQAEFQAGKLARDDLANLNRLVTSLPPGTLSWDEDAHRFEVHSLREPNPAFRTPGLPMGQPGESPLEAATTKVARPIVENLNRTINTLAEGIYRTEGKDVDGEIMKWLYTANQGNQQGVVKQLADLMMAGRRKQTQENQDNVDTVQRRQ